MGSERIPKRRMALISRDMDRKMAEKFITAKPHLGKFTFFSQSLSNAVRVDGSMMKSRLNVYAV
jgi:hypothetical protein